MHDRHLEDLETTTSVDAPVGAGSPPKHRLPWGDEPVSPADGELEKPVGGAHYYVYLDSYEGTCVCGVVLNTAYSGWSNSPAKAMGRHIEAASA